MKTRQSTSINTHGYQMRIYKDNGEVSVSKGGAFQCVLPSLDTALNTFCNESNHLNIADVALLVDMIIAQSEKTDVLYLKQEYSALIDRVKNLNDKTRPAM